MFLVDTWGVYYMEKLTLDELKVLESIKNTLKELSKEDLEKVLDFSRELQDINYSKGKNDSRDGKGQK